MMYNFFRKILFLNVFLLFLSFSNAQTITQTIRGNVYDALTESPLVGATVVILDENGIITNNGTVTDLQGNFRFATIPVGRVNLEISYLGYKPVKLSSLILSAGKEMLLTIGMEEQVFQSKEVVIVENRKKDQPLNKMATVSARSFSIAETERYAGSLGDPARMATNYAGVRVSSDQVNDIVIRGNSPSGLLWKLEGINIPNPNHFGSMGSTGGPISMLNNNVLGNSDFFTSAFPAEYGNALAGVFDLNIRSGNNEKREYLAQFGINGFEGGLEGPFSLKNQKSTYLVNYRYSDMSFVNYLGFDLGLSVIPLYQDLCFKLDFPSLKKGKISIFGLGGLNTIGADLGYDSVVSAYNTKSKVGLIGISHTLSTKNKSRFKTVFASSWQLNSSEDYKIINDSLIDNEGNSNYENKLMFSTEYRKKFSSTNNISAGLQLDLYNFNFKDSFYIRNLHKYFSSFDIKDQMLMFQTFLQWHHSFSDKLSTVAGIHLQKINLNNEFSVEPRFGINWNINPVHSFSAGYGLHSQAQPLFIYFTKTLIDPVLSVYEYTNKNLGFSKSHHFVTGYNYHFRDHHRIKAEIYYQYLFNIPVESVPSLVSLINYGSSFVGIDNDSLVNNGTGENYGLEFTLEKFLNKNYYYLVTLSLFNSTYKGSDEVNRNTMYNGNFVFNGLGGYELKIKKKNALLFDIKFCWAGGTRKIPIDIDKSILAGRTVYNMDLAYEIKNPDYYRVDARISYKLNLKKTSHLFAFDFTNVTNHKNNFIEYFDNNKNQIVQVGQLGLLPVVLYRVQF